MDIFSFLQDLPYVAQTFGVLARVSGRRPSTYGVYVRVKYFDETEMIQIAKTKGNETIPWFGQ